MSESHRPGTFASLRVRSFRLLLAAQAASTSGMWILRIAQDWLVLDLTGSATAVGVVTGLQFLPIVLFGLAGGWLADRFSKRCLLVGTQVATAALTGLLAGLTLTGQVGVWHVYFVAFGLGVVLAVDQPARQAFIADMVDARKLRNAIGLNASVYQLSALVGPALSAALLIGAGPGAAFGATTLLHGASLAALSRIRNSDLIRPEWPAGRGGLGDGLRYIAQHQQVRYPILLVTGVAFALNLPIVLAAYAKTVFDAGPGGYGLLTSALAVGSLAGALLGARRSRITLNGLFAAALALGALLMCGSAMPNMWSLSLMLMPVGAASLLLFPSANATVQLAVDAALRGRVMAVYLLTQLGAYAIGAPLLGSVVQHLGAPTGLLLAGAACSIVAVVLWGIHRAQHRGSHASASFRVAAAEAAATR